MKLCKDCKHFKSGSDGNDRYGTCEAPQAYDIPNYVTGENERTWTLCSIHRDASDERKWLKIVPPLGRCGKAAHWFEPKKTS